MASNPALKQLWLVPFAVIPGLLAYLRILSPNQAAICVLALYLVSRWHAAKIQREFEARSSSPSPSPSSTPSPSPSQSSNSTKQRRSKRE